MSVATRTGFPQFVNESLPLGLPGDFYGANPRVYALVATESGIGYRVAPGQTVTVGYFCWYDPATGLVYGAATANCLVGFVHREQGQTIIESFMGIARATIREGFAVSIFSKGEFLAEFTGGATVNGAVYAVTATGQPTMTSGGNVATGFTARAAALVDAAFTASIAADTGVMTITAIASGIPAAGQFLSGTNVPANIQITSQLSGSAGSTGTYQTNSRGRAAVASTSINGSQGKVAPISNW